MFISNDGVPQSLTCSRAIIVPVVSIPFLVSIWGYQWPRDKTCKGRVTDVFISKWTQADVPGLLLFVAGLVLLLLPMTLSVRFHDGWASPQILAMVVAGTISFTGFVLYELYIARCPILPLRLAKSRTVAAGCLTQALFSLSYYLWQPYFYSFLVVVNGLSPKTATNVVMAQGVSAAAVGLAAAFVVKYTGNCKWMIVAGTLVKTIGGGLMIRYSNTNATLAQIVMGQIIAGGGSGMISIVVQTAVQSVASHQGEFLPILATPFKLTYKPEMWPMSRRYTKQRELLVVQLGTLYRAPSGPGCCWSSCKHIFQRRPSRKPVTYKTPSRSPRLLQREAPSALPSTIAMPKSFTFSSLPPSLLWSFLS